MTKTPEQVIAEFHKKIQSLQEQLKKQQDKTKYGLIREEKIEKFEENTQNALPVLKENKALLVGNQHDLDHLIIEWDNYHTLKALNYTHQGKIDLIYIDPPYNTGNKDFVYNDNYVDPDDDYRHSKWLSFMAKRLKLAKELLSDEGSIFISIDDNEQANLKLLCDIIFKEENFIKTLVRESGKPFGFKATKTTRPRIHEYILHYCKNKNKIGYKPTYTETTSSSWEKILTGSLIKVETDKIYSMDFIQWAKESTITYGLSSFWSGQKPIKLIKKFILAGASKSSTILDFFAWSGTTGHAVLDLNKKDGGSRQFILCSSKENSKQEPNKNICRDITYERAKRVLQGYNNTKGESILWLWWGNLRYYTTEFIKTTENQINKSLDDLRRNFIYCCDELLCIKENTFIPYQSDCCSKDLKCYYKNNHYTVIIYDAWQIEKLHTLLKTLQGKIALYIFESGRNETSAIFDNHAENLTIKSIPDDVLETYKKIFNS